VTAGASTPPTATPPSPAGLGAPGLVALLLVGTGVGAAVDLVISGDLGWGINIAFVVAAVLAAAAAGRRDLLACVLAAPITFGVVVTGAVMVTDGYDGLVRTGLVVATELALLAPGVWLGTVLAAVIVLLRRRAMTRRLT
jgi:hypothetical protein